MSELQMTGAAELTAASKKVAMRLSGISQEDRQWILDRLTSTQRVEVQSAYHQLQSLRGNEPIDFSVFFDDEGTGETQAQRDRGEFLVNRIGYDAVQHVLDDLSVDYVAAFLRSDVWHDSGEYLSACAPHRAAQLRAVKPAGMTVHSTQALADAIARLAMNP